MDMPWDFNMMEEYDYSSSNGTESSAIAVAAMSGVIGAAFPENFTEILQLDRDTLLEQYLNLNLTAKDENSNLYPLTLVVVMTVVYAVIFVTGVVGNVSTCIVIARNKSMHTATNYYLFSLAVSDMLLLISGLPPEMYRLWSPETYVFGEALCVLQSFAAETSANATVLTITAFTVERYFAICHPFLSHTMSKLSRAIRYIIAIWIMALCLAAPQAIQFGVEYETKNGLQLSRCTVVSKFFEHAFEISTFVFFVGPMTLITVLYVLIGIQLRKSRNIATPKRPSLSNASNMERSRNAAAQNRVVKMLIAVVAAFFICWAPFHAQRLLAVYLASASTEAQETTITIYMILMYVSGVLYFLSTTINPVLYHIMSNKFREAFKKTLMDVCRRKSGRRTVTRTYSVLSRCPPSLRNLQRSVSEGGVQTAEQLNLKTSAGKTIKHQTSAFLGKPTRQDSACGNNRRAFRPRVLSESSQASALSTPSSVDNRQDEKSEKKIVFDNNNVHHPHQDDRYLGTIRYKMLRLFRKPPTARQYNSHLYRQGSVESAHTISNSSLQDMDEIDYSSSDLVRYMEEINEDIA